MSDLTSLMGVAPLNASFMIGQNNAQNQQSEGLRQQELAQLMQQRQAQESRLQGREPYELERLGLANQTTSAQLPGVQATSRRLGVDADVAEGTKQTSIDKKNFDANNEMYTKVAGQLSSMVGDLNGVPDIEKPARIRDGITQLGLPQGAADRLWQKVTAVPPAQMAEKLKEFSDAMLRANSAYAQHMDSTNMTNDMHIVRGAAQDASQERIAQIGADSRVKAAVERASARHQSVEESINSSKTALERYQKLNDAATVAELNQEPEIARRYRVRAANELKQATEELRRGPPAGGASIGAVTGLQTNPPPDIAPPGAVAPASGVQVPQFQSVQQLRQAHPEYKDKTDAELRAAFKRQYGVDLK